MALVLNALDSRAEPPTEHREGHVDAEDPGQSTHLREPMRGRIEHLLVEPRPGNGRQLELALQDKQRQLLGLGGGGLRRGDVASAQGVPGRESSSSSRSNQPPTRPRVSSTSARTGAESSGSVESSCRPDTQHAAVKRIIGSPRDPGPTSSSRRS